MAEFIHELLERNARKYSFDEAVKWPEKGVSLTWDQLNKRASSLAYQLKNRGIKPGDRVALFMPNRPEFVIGFFGALKTGAVVVPVNARFTASEVSYILENSGAAALLYDDDLRPVAEDAVKSCSSVSFTFSAGEIWACGKEDSFFSASVHANPAEVLAEIIYTSGTTGKPKGVMLTHAAVYAVASMMAYECNIKYRNRVLQLMPLTHSAPLNLLLVGAVYAGAATVLGTFSPRNMVELAAMEKTTHFFGAPVAYLLAAKLPNFAQYDLSGERLWIYGGAPMSREAVIQVMQRFGGRFMGVYGLTEAGPNGSALFPHEHPDFAGSIGSRATVNAEIRIVDGEGRDVPCGEVGELIIRTPSNMIGYYRNEEATQETLKEGWLYTGDMARRDKSGYMWIVDRKKDIIITGGVNVYPREIEDVLTACPQVADAAVVGVPHPEWGETVAALVVPRDESDPPDVGQIKDFCRQRLADYKVPRLIKFASAIPRNPTGKVLKEDVRKFF